MPNRILKETINESRALAECSPFAQDLFKRLITYADDYGRFNADYSIMRARLFPLEIDEVFIETIEEAIVELIGAEKVSLYRELHSGKPTGKVFGYLPGWFDHQRKRDNKSKFPDPKDEWNDWALQRCIPLALRIELCERDRFTCKNCHRNYGLKGLTTRQAMRILGGVFHFDHVVPVGQGGRATLENLRLLCASCNRGRKKRIGLEEMRQLAATGGMTPHIASSIGEQPPAKHPAVKATENDVFDVVFWALYPSRNGKKLEKDETRKRFSKLSLEDQALCCQAVKNFAASQQVKEGFGVKDPKRFIRDGSGQEPWRDWITPDRQVVSNGKATSCVGSAREEGSQRMRACGEPIAPPETNPDQRPFCVKCLPLRIALDARLKGRAT